MLDQHDVRQMQVAMAPPHISLSAALLQQLPDSRKRGSGRLLEVIDIAGGKAGCGSECRGSCPR